MEAIIILGETRWDVLGAIKDVWLITGGVCRAGIHRMSRTG